MKGNNDVLGALNEALAEELTAINQYFLHSEMYESWGFHKLSGMVKKESIDEMKHAEKIIERILFLEGTPNMAKPLKMNIGKTVPEMMENDLTLETAAFAMYNRLIGVATKVEDFGSAEILRSILKDEENHVDLLEQQVGLIKELGLQNYLAVQT
jgi:bacterioferritin